MPKTKNVSKKPTAQKKHVQEYSCKEVENYLDKAIDGVKKEILPMISNLDKRDSDQFESARKIIIDANTVMVKRQEHTEKIAEAVQRELNNMTEKQDNVVANINNSMVSLHDKFDAHIADEDLTFKKISSTLVDIQEHGTKLAQVIDAKLNKIQVNGGIYPLNEAIQHIYQQHIETHTKLDEVVALVEPWQTRRKWIATTKELIKKNGFLKFVFTTKIGALFGLMTVLLIVNTILVDVFRINFDIKSIFIWLLGIFPNQ